jgi:hypothetical protein
MKTCSCSKQLTVHVHLSHCTRLCAATEMQLPSMKFARVHTLELKAGIVKRLGPSPFGSDCSGASVLSSSPPSSAEYYSNDGPAQAVFHALAPASSWGCGPPWMPWAAWCSR